MSRSKDGIIVLAFMIVVALLNASIKRGESVTTVVNNIRKDVVVGVPEIPENDLEAMQRQIELHLAKSSVSWDDASSIVGYEYIGNYVLRGKSNKQVRYPYQIYLVDRVWVAVGNDFSEFYPYYYLVNFYDADLNEEGGWEINVKQNKPENKTYEVRNETGLGYQLVEGYETIDDLYALAIEGQLEEYKCTADIDEDKTAQIYFEQADVADIKWMAEFEEAAGGTAEETAPENFEDSRLAKWAEITGEGVTEDGRFAYDAQGDTVTITKYLGQETEVSIPEEIAYRTKIILGEGAFLETNVTSLTLSDSVIEIKQFNNLSIDDVPLERIDIPGSVKTIEFHVFHGCTNLKEVVMGEGVTTIEECAFYKCTSLETIEVPSTVTYIHKYAFKNSAITSISVKNGCEAEGLIRDWTEPITVEYYD